MSMRNWLAAGFLLAAAATVAAAADAEKTEFPQRKLRGFGTVSATAEPGKLTIRAESAEKAALWQAKYLKDLTKTVGTAKTVKIDGWTACELPGGAFSVAVRDGKTVTVVSAPNRDELLKKIRAFGLRPTAKNTVSDAKIPMYLDSFDQYAFRFYYWPGQRPPNRRGDYDPTGEFDFAKKVGDTGFIFWSNAHNADAAAGLSDENSWNWAYRMAQRRNLPIVLNTNAGSVPSVANAFRSENVGRAPDYAGSYHAVGEPYFGGTGFISWASTNARKAELQTLQNVIRKYGQAEQVIEFLEPHGELNHGNYTVFLEYGPLADRSFREFLKERYKTLEAVSRRYGRAFKDWNAVRLPEVAEFFGWNERILNLAGTWKIGYLPLKAGGRTPAFEGVNGDWKIEAGTAPAEWFTPGFNDSEWKTIRRMPGSDEVLFLPKQPAVLRSKFTLEKVPAGRVWLYLWDLNQGTGSTVEAWVNGEKVGSDTVRHNVPHWGAYEVTGKLRSGENSIALLLPKTAICYRVYLSGFEPKSYPALGAAKNALWSDFSDWQGWSRNRAVELGMAAIREVDPNRGVVSMAPDSYHRQLREIARKYGAHFHNTGYMGGFFADLLPMMMRGADLPMSLEPGGPAADLPGFKHMTGLYMIEGVNAIHYFIHVGSIYWNEPIRRHFEKILPALKMLGRQHQEKADVAMLLDSDISALLGYPWVADNNAAYPAGYWEWRFNEALRNEYPLDAVTPDDFGNGLAAKYKILLDTNSTMLRPETLAGIEKWVRDGGIFVSMFQTGRHSPEVPDSWEIQRLSGYAAQSISRYKGREPESRDSFELVPGNRVFTGSTYHAWMNGDGVKLKSVAPDTVPLLRWRDGSVAAGMRKVGKGAVITFGVRLPFWEATTRNLLGDLLRFAGAKPLGLIAGNQRQFYRHYVSNNGLYDVWVIWNSERSEQPYEFKFRSGTPKNLTDVLTGKPAELKGVLPANEFKMLISPRPQAAGDGAAKWFGVKYGWWQGTEKPAGTVSDASAEYRRDTLPLTDGWELRELAPDASVEATFRDRAAWRRLPGAGALLRDIDVRSTRLLLKCSVTVPANWNDGEITLWCTGQYLSGSADGQLRFFLNGKEIAAPGRNHGVANLVLPVKAGETFVLGIEALNGSGLLRGVQGATFLHYRPNPEKTVSLKGIWRVRRGVDDPREIRRKVPGLIDGSIATRNFTLEAIPAGKRVCLYMIGQPVLSGVIVNGHYVRRHHHMIGEMTDLDITPWVKTGENEISVIAQSFDPNLRARIRRIELHIRK